MTNGEALEKITQDLSKLQKELDDVLERDILGDGGTVVFHTEYEICALANKIKIAKYMIRRFLYRRSAFCENADLKELFDLYIYFDMMSEHFKPASDAD